MTESFGTYTCAHCGKETPGFEHLVTRCSTCGKDHCQGVQCDDDEQVDE
ncbi:hypothetical protein [Phytohabitans suffuscus]|nr:hypothetical protein [Phytohabitans suffuscus]